jgi:hypothetical protein
MRENALQALETDEQTEKRAQSEAFEFAVAGNVVRVTDGSHQHPDEHTDRVQLDERGVPSSCTCKAYESHPGACKHMTAVAIRKPLLEAARAARDAPRIHAIQNTHQLRTDGGGERDRNSDSDFTAASEGVRWVDDSQNRGIVEVELTRRSIMLAEQEAATQHTSLEEWIRTQIRKILRPGGEHPDIRDDETSVEFSDAHRDDDLLDDIGTAGIGDDDESAIDLSDVPGDGPDETPDETDPDTDHEEDDHADRESGGDCR